MFYNRLTLSKVTVHTLVNLSFLVFSGIICYCCLNMLNILYITKNCKVKQYPEKIVTGMNRQREYVHILVCMTEISVWPGEPPLANMRESLPNFAKNKCMVGRVYIANVPHHSTHIHKKEQNICITNML